MRQFILPLLLLTTATLSLSDVLPIVTVDQADAEPENDQEYDNTFNQLQNNHNIFYELLNEASDNEKPKSRRKFYNKIKSPRNSNPISNQDENYDDKGYRKEQWHNYPRQLDRLHRSSYNNEKNEDIPINFDDGEKNTRNTESTDNVPQYNQVIDNDIEDVAGPLLILKIRLAFLTDNMKNLNSNKNEYNPVASDSVNLNKISRKDEEYYAQYEKKMEPTVNYKRERKGKVRNKDMTFSEVNTDDKKSVNKRIFSLWSRLQSLSHKGHELHHRRHLYTFYGLPDNGGTLTAETRASLVRPPGSPLRWG